MGQIRAQLEEGPLGKISEHPTTYTPSLLHSIDRAEARQSLQLDWTAVQGEDLWTGYEFSWLDIQGKPQVAGLRLRVACQSKAIVESKSLKLYLNSFAMTKFETQADVMNTLDKDLSLAFRAPVLVELLDLKLLNMPVSELSGTSLDDLDILVAVYTRDEELLALEAGHENSIVNEALHTHLFRSLCPVTGQPDWASIAIEYSGAPINKEALLRYLISYRNHQAFHEATIEQIYDDIWVQCHPNQLSVYGRFQRRGGLDINPLRSNVESSAPVCRLPRQ